MIEESSLKTWANDQVAKVIAVTPEHIDVGVTKVKAKKRLSKLWDKLSNEVYKKLNAYSMPSVYCKDELKEQLRSESYIDGSGNEYMLSQQQVDYITSSVSVAVDAAWSAVVSLCSDSIPTEEVPEAVLNEDWKWNLKPMIRVDTTFGPLQNHMSSSDYGKWWKSTVDGTFSVTELSPLKSELGIKLEGSGDTFLGKLTMSGQCSLSFVHSTYTDDEINQVLKHGWYYSWSLHISLDF